MTTRRRGFALLATLWLVVAIGVVSIEWGLRGQEHRKAVINTLDRQTARIAAESGLAVATAFLDDLLRLPTTERAPTALGLVDPWADLGQALPDSIGDLGAGVWRVTVDPAGTKLDLNETDVHGLTRFLEALRVDGAQAERIAQSIADWRDLDDAYRARGAEREWYERAGRIVLPPNRPFQSLAELRNVRGVTDDVFARAAPMLTVDGGERINLMVAPRPVLLALPGIGEEMVRLLQRRQREHRLPETIHLLGAELSPDARALLYSHLPELTARATFQIEAVQVTSVGQVEGSPTKVRMDAIVARSGNQASVVRRTVIP